MSFFVFDFPVSTIFFLSNLVWVEIVWEIDAVNGLISTSHTPYAAR